MAEKPTKASRRFTVVLKEIAPVLGVVSSLVALPVGVMQDLNAHPSTPAPVEVVLNETMTAPESPSVAGTADSVDPGTHGLHTTAPAR